MILSGTWYATIVALAVPSNDLAPDFRQAQTLAIAGKLLSDAKKKFPWYDAVWLRQYVAATGLLAALKPQRLAAFVRAFEPLRTRLDFSIQTVPQVFGSEVLARIRETVAALPADTIRHHEAKRFGREVVHNREWFGRLQQDLLPMVRDLAGEPIEASYNFLSRYGSSGVCEPHIDAPSAKWTLDICIEQDESWPIYFSQVVPWPEQRVPSGPDWQTEIRESSDLRFEAVNLEPNQAVLFAGSSQWHYRNPRRAGQGARPATLLFFHYIPAGTADLIRPSNWPELFDLPELASVVRPPSRG